MPDAYKDLKNLAFRSGKIAKKYFRNPDLHNVEIKEDMTPVTAADIKINEMIIDWVKKHQPHWCVLGEERIYGDIEADIILVVDPIDGTIPFASGVPMYTVVLALMVGGETVMSVIYDPERDDMSCYYRGRTYFNYEQMGYLADVTQLKDSRINAQYWVDSPSNIDQLHGALMKHGVKATNFPALAYMAGLMLNGDLHASVFPINSARETVAMAPMIEAIGGKATNLLGEPLTYTIEDTKDGPQINMNGGCMMAVNPQLHEQLVEMYKCM